MEQHPDQKYIDAFVNNDRKLINEIYKEYRELIIRQVMQNSGTREKGKDHFNDVLILLFTQAVEKGITLTCSFKSFLYLVSKRHWINKLNKGGSKKVTFVDPAGCINIGDDTAAQLAADALFDTCTQLILKHLDTLGDNCKNFIKSKVFEKMSSKEIATIFKTSPNYVNKHTSKCFKQLREKVKSDPKFEESCFF